MEPTPQFGTRLPGLSYDDRPAAFGLAEREGRLALVRVRKSAQLEWLDLPGGGVESGEASADALIREFGEETGLMVANPEPFAVADQYFIKTDGSAHNNRQTFFAVRVVQEGLGLKIEADHTLEWVEPQAALTLLRHDSHAWAVLAWMRRYRPA